MIPIRDGGGIRDWLWKGTKKPPIANIEAVFSYPQGPNLRYILSFTEVAQRLLICIEEPKLGLNPDVLPTLADLLKEASERCQLIVTTHSDVLVDAMSDQPESILIAEKTNCATSLTRLDANGLKPWLEK